MRLADVCDVQAVALLAARRAARSRCWSRGDSSPEPERLVEAILHLLDGQRVDVALDVLTRAFATVERPLVELAEQAAQRLYQAGRPPGREVACEPREALRPYRVSPEGCAAEG